MAKASTITKVIWLLIMTNISTNILSDSASDRVEVAIVGAGIVGLAHALAAARKGLKVAVFDRNLQAVGASIRNFGMIWPIGQPTGKLYDRATRSKQIWQEVAPLAGIHLDPCGSLHLAYRLDEMDVLEEFISTTSGYDATILSPEQVETKSQAVVMEDLLGALWSDREMTVDPREAIAKLPGFLQQKYGVEFHFGTVVTEISHPNFVVGGKKWSCDRLFVCSGADFETLYPEVYAATNITKSKLQMMRTVAQPENWKLNPCLCAGLTLTHYSSFAHCQTLDALKTRIETETPQYPEWGIHVLVSQNAIGEVVLGDSHEYGLNPSPFDKAEINQYVLDYLKTFARFPSLEIAETWNGVYSKLPGKTEFIVAPEPGVTIVNGLSGAGMTLSFGLAEEVLAEYV
jgi:D-hydroxyproline dehydrogenase subunit beta